VPDSILQVQAAAQAQATLRAQAQAALDKSDVTFLRAQEAGQAWPAEWVTYRAALRASVRTGTGTIPALPTTYPDGTPTA
jgi:hypothetical protein